MHEVCWDVEQPEKPAIYYVIITREKAEKIDISLWRHSISRVSLPGFPEWISRETPGIFPSRIPGEFVPLSRDEREIFDILNLQYHDQL